jgi:hypothetical protein
MAGRFPSYVACIFSIYVVFVEIARAAQKTAGNSARSSFNISSVASQAEILSLPGYDGPLPSRHFAGTVC